MRENEPVSRVIFGTQVPEAFDKMLAGWTGDLVRYEQNERLYESNLPLMNEPTVPAFTFNDIFLARLSSCV